MCGGPERGKKSTKICYITIFCRVEEEGGYIRKTLADKNNVYHAPDLDSEKRKNARMGKMGADILRGLLNFFFFFGPMLK